MPPDPRRTWVCCSLPPARHHHKHQQSGCDPVLVWLQQHTTLQHPAPGATVPVLGDATSPTLHWEGLPQVPATRHHVACQLPGTRGGWKSGSRCWRSEGSASPPVSLDTTFPVLGPGQAGGDAQPSPAWCKAAPAAGKSPAAKPSCRLIHPLPRLDQHPAPGPIWVDTFAGCYQGQQLADASKHQSQGWEAAGVAAFGQLQGEAPLYIHTGAQRDPAGQEPKQYPARPPPGPSEGLSAPHRLFHKPGAAHGHSGRQELNPGTLKAQIPAQGLPQGCPHSASAPHPSYIQPHK